MVKTVKIGFREQSKAVTAEVDVTYTDEPDKTNEEIEEEAERLYDKAQEFSKAKTIQKM